MTQAWRDLTGTDDGTRLFPDAERAAQRDELADVIRRVIGDEQDGAQIRLVALAGRNLSRSGLRHHAPAPSSSRATRVNDAMLSFHAASLGGSGAGQ